MCRDVLGSKARSLADSRQVFHSAASIGNERLAKRSRKTSFSLTLRFRRVCPNVAGSREPKSVWTMTVMMAALNVIRRESVRPSWVIVNTAILATGVPGVDQGVKSQRKHTVSMTARRRWKRQVLSLLSKKRTDAQIAIGRSGRKCERRAVSVARTMEARTRTLGSVLFISFFGVETPTFLPGRKRHLRCFS